MELTIEQKVELLEKILSRERKLPEVDMTVVPMEWYAILRSGTVVVSKPFQLPTVGSKFDGWYDYSYEAFEPERNLVQAIELLERLSIVQNDNWHLIFFTRNTYGINNGLEVGQGVSYTEYGFDTCELIVSACLWWLENKGEE